MEQINRSLPNDMIRECLYHLPYNHLSIAASVFKHCSLEIDIPEFLRLRKTAGHSQNIIVMAKAHVSDDSCTAPVYRLLVWEAESMEWSELPLPAAFSNGLPAFCQIVGAGTNLAVIGGWDHVSWEVSKAVFIYDFGLATWRRGADMPGVPRSLFGSASDFKGTVFVAGGHDKGKNALRSVMAYNVDKEEWVSLPDMAMERDECKAVFVRGSLHVVGGYCTDKQGSFEKSAEVLDFVTWKWSQLKDDSLGDSLAVSACVGKLYLCYEGYVAVDDGGKLQKVAKLPQEVLHLIYFTAWQNRLLVIGCKRVGEAHMAYALDLNDNTWTNINIPKEYSWGYIHSGCCLEI